MNFFKKKKKTNKRTINFEGKQIYLISFSQKEKKMVV
jgi:hypothetical protein